MDYLKTTNINGIYLNDIVEDNSGVLGVVLDINPDDENYSLGILFTDTDEEYGLFWCSATNHVEYNGGVEVMKVTKVQAGTEKYNQFMAWYEEYQKQFYD